MPHVDEGRLHAYLDGEIARGQSSEAAAELDAIERHLDVCAECRASLEQARRLRNRASGILSASAPARFETPPFEQIRARAAAEVTRGRVTQLSRLRALAWAATIVLAVGVGWVARGALRREAQAPMPRAFRSAVAAEADSLAEARPVVSGEPAADRPAAPEATAGRGVSSVPEPGESQNRAKAAEGLRGQAPAVPAAVEQETRLPEGQAQARTDALAARPERIADSVAELLESREALFDSAEARRQRLAQRVAAEPAPAPATVVAVGANELKAETPVWSPADAGEAREHLGAELLAIADLPIIGYATGTMDGRPAVRVLQRLARGDTVDLVLQHEAPVARDETQRPEAAGRRLERRRVSLVEEYRGAYRIVIEGALTADSLRELLAKVR